MNTVLIFVGMCLTATTPTNNIGSISGVVVNGSHRDEAIANADVILRVVDNGTQLSIAETTSDQYGRFTFDDLAVDQKIVYLPGANLDGVHYPGPRVRLTPNQATSNVKLVAFETVEEPSPLIARKHELTVHATTGVLEITESISIENPSRATYVGKKTRETAPATLRLALPPDFESVTFHDEFHGRSFFVLDGKLMTDIPWTPGSRQITFTYRIPIEHRGQVLTRSLDLPCSDIKVLVKSDEIENVSCNLATVSRSQQEICFEQSGSLLPAGHQVLIQLVKLPVPLMGYARWAALTVLVVLITCGAAQLVRRAAPTKVVRSAG